MLNLNLQIIENENLYVKPQITVIEVEVEGVIATSAQLGDFTDGGSGW